jgi:hypothetical protein
MGTKCDDHGQYPFLLAMLGAEEEDGRNHTVGLWWRQVASTYAELVKLVPEEEENAALEVPISLFTWCAEPPSTPETPADGGSHHPSSVQMEAPEEEKVAPMLDVPQPLLNRFVDAPPTPMATPTEVTTSMAAKKQNVRAVSDAGARAERHKRTPRGHKSAAGCGPGRWRRRPSWWSVAVPRGPRRTAGGRGCTHWGRRTFTIRVGGWG